MSNDAVNIKDKIYTIRGKQVILDRDLAVLYEVSTGNLNKAVKRNIDRFPENFMFRLTGKELEEWKFQIGTSNSIKKGLRKLPNAFTEQGVAMLSGILKSKKAITVSINIMEAFVAMRHFLIKNEQIFRRLDYVERKQIEYQFSTDKNFNKVFQAIEERHIIPKQGIFFDGQIYDAYKFIVDLIKQAKKEIVLIDNYVDESVLTLLSNKNKEVTVIIYTTNISNSLILAQDKFNKQYNKVEIKKFNKSHDRFLSIDNEIYLIGASLKDLGKKWFGFFKLKDKNVKEIRSKLK